MVFVGVVVVLVMKLFKVLCDVGRLLLSVLVILKLCFLSM